MAEFWNDEITAKSYERLLALRQEADFVLIGGWAIYLHTRAYKSKDIDIVVDYAQLLALRKKYSVSKNEFLKKYEIRGGHFDIDIYLPKFSRLAVPAEELLQEYAMVEGMKVAQPEALALLKQAAYEARKGTIKGKKDALDIALLLLLPSFSFEEFRRLGKKYGEKKNAGDMKEILLHLGDADLAYLKIARTAFLKRRKEILKELQG